MFKKDSTKQRKTYALIRDESGQLFATDGICTHGNTHLVDGLVKGGIIECAKNNGRFNLADGSPARAPICRGLATYPIAERGGRIWLNIKKARGVGAEPQKTYTLRVVSNRSVATFIKELVLEPVDSTEKITSSRRLPSNRHTGLRSNPLPGFRHSAALRHGMGKPARLRSHGE